MTRICITGGPRTGKTTLAASLGESAVVRHTDDLIRLGWSEASQAACEWLDEPGPWIIEGVAVSRALRKWRDQNPGKPPPVDRVIMLDRPHVAWNDGQRTMAAGVATVHAEIDGWLRRHGIATEWPSFDSMTAHQLRVPSMGGET